MADLKSFVTTEENQTCHGRYNDVKLAKNCCPAFAANDIHEEDASKDDARISIITEEFLTLLRRAFPGDKPADIRAVLKRAVVFVFVKSALYLPFPLIMTNFPMGSTRAASWRGLLAMICKELKMISQSMTEYLSDVQRKAMSLRLMASFTTSCCRSSHCQGPATIFSSAQMVILQRFSMTKTCLSTRQDLERVTALTRSTL